MDELLSQETEKLQRSWMRHDPAWLRQYLVSGVEDPRLNLQSILTRHFLIQELQGERFGDLMQAEHRFAAAMNWLRDFAIRFADPEDFETVGYALSRGADNAEGLEIPRWLLQLFAKLPGRASGCEIPNYIQQFLDGGTTGQKEFFEPLLDLFAEFWTDALRSEDASGAPAKTRRSVLEPACGSANDFRFFQTYGLVDLLDYTGVDLCLKNVENARALFPGVRYEMGNVFELGAPDKCYEVCIVQDLFEHLSIGGMEVAVKELCRVTRSAICIGFFQMDEMRDHVVRIVDEYHFNTLSMERMRRLFSQHGFSGRAVHIGTFLRETVGCDNTHNPNAYTFMLHAQ
jgi:SAM-dependent methyltransferase